MVLKRTREAPVPVDGRAADVYRTWLRLTRGADQFSPNGTRRPHWLMRPLRPAKEAYRLPDPREPARTAGS